MSNIPLKQDNVGQFFVAEEYNDLTVQIQGVELDAGGSNISRDRESFRKGLASYASISNFYIDSGTANDYVLNPQGAFKTPIDAPSSWNGMLIRFRATNTNTGVSTISLAGLGGGSPINVLNEDGTVLTGGEIVTTRDTFLRYNITLNAFLVLNSSIFKSINTLLTPSKPIILSYVNGTTLNYTSGTFDADDYSGRFSLNAGTINLTGLTTNTSFYIFAIYNPTTNSSTVLQSNSITPTLPSGFTNKRLIFAAVTNSSSQVRPFTMYEDGYIAYNILTQENTITLNATNYQGFYGLTVPLGITHEVRIHAFTTDKKSIWIGDGTQIINIINNIQANFLVAEAPDIGVRIESSMEFNKRTNTNSQIYISTKHANISLVMEFTIFTHGYKIISY